MAEYKTCSKCFLTKEIGDFYLCAGKFRSECKNCTILRNTKYQKRAKAWKSRDVDDDVRRMYMREYYAQHREKFAEYRARFKQKYPDYYKLYFRNRKKKRLGD